jgi:hypothetical protein
LATLVEILGDPSKKQAVVDDGVALIEREVEAKGGLSGMAIKGGFKTVKALQPGMIAKALHFLLPDFAPAIDPLFAKAQQSGDVKGWFRGHSGEIAEALLHVTDEKAARAKQAVLKKVYSGLRGQAKGHVEAAVPGLADLVLKHVK